jgi:hypothetical protein
LPKKLRAYRLKLTKHSISARLSFGKLCGLTRTSVNRLKKFWGTASSHFGFDIGRRAGWIFEEIGKELPITVAVVIEERKIIDLTVLEFRESRGGEVVYPFFTGQFNSVKLKTGKTYSLDKSIDGITGATLSVRALKKVATLALYCHQQTELLQE